MKYVFSAPRSLSYLCSIRNDFLWPPHVEEPHVGQAGLGAGAGFGRQSMNVNIWLGFPMFLDFFPMSSF